MANKVVTIVETTLIVEKNAMIWKRFHMSSFRVVGLLMLNSPLHA
jgi:hypothetical protein